MSLPVVGFVGYDWDLQEIFPRAAIGQLGLRSALSLMGDIDLIAARCSFSKSSSTVLRNPNQKGVKLGNCPGDER